MARRTMPTRGRRESERGAAAVVVALSAVSLLTITGLAIDGGMEAAAYRHAQNAADAGALAAARLAYINAITSPQLPADPAALTQAATTEVNHNNAQLASVTTGGGTPVAVPAPLTVWLPTGGGMTGQSALAHLEGTAGTALLPVDATLDLGGTQSTSTWKDTSVGGSVASSQVDLMTTSSPTLGTSAASNCYTARAQFATDTDVTGAATPCPPTGGTAAVGVSASGTFLGGYGTDAEVTHRNWPSAQPVAVVLNPAGSIVGAGVGNTRSFSATEGGSGSSLRWDPITGLTATAQVYAANLVGSTPHITLSSTGMNMRVREYIDPKTGTPTFDRYCTPGSFNLADVGRAVSGTVYINSSCVAYSTSGSGSISVSGSACAGAQSNGNSANACGSVAVYETASEEVDVAWTSPSSGSVCSTSNGGTTVSCTVQTCYVHVVDETDPFTSSLCLGEADITLTGTAVNNSLLYTGDISVAATVPQSTYFLRVIGWNQTSPTAGAKADAESVVDESDAAFAASPFAIPTMGTMMTSPYTYEHLTPGHTYYLYGTDMQSNNPAPAMPAAWQGQLTAGSARRTGTTVTGSSVATPATPTLYGTGGTYYLEPVIDPVTGVVQFWGAFAPVASNAHWGTLVKAIPTQTYIVQSTSVPGWVTMDEGAVSVKLEQ